MSTPTSPVPLRPYTTATDEHSARLTHFACGPDRTRHPGTDGETLETAVSAGEKGAGEEARACLWEPRLPLWFPHVCFGV